MTVHTRETSAASKEYIGKTDKMALKQAFISPTRRVVGTYGSQGVTG